MGCWTPCQSQSCSAHSEYSVPIFRPFFFSLSACNFPSASACLAANFLGRSSLQKQDVSNGLVLARLLGRTMALPLLAAERQASPVCVWAGPRSGATARRPGMASTGHKVKVKRSWTQPSQKPLILVGQDPIIRRCAGDSPQAAPQPRDGVSSADPDGPYMYRYVGSTLGITCDKKY